MARPAGQLECIADAGNGSCHDASRTVDLSEAMGKITQRALRPFQISGTPVKGTEDSATAPNLGPGQYADSYDAAGSTRYYRIPRTPGSTITASITILVRPYNGQNVEPWELELAASDGTSCATESVGSQEFQGDHRRGGRRQQRCQGARRGLRARSDVDLGAEPRFLSRQQKSAPVEIAVAEEPPIRNLAILPEPLTSYDDKGTAVEPSRPVRTILGGTAFSNAPVLASGTFTDSLAVGETVVYRVRLETGQRLRVTVDTPAPKSDWHLGSTEAVAPRLMLFAVSRVLLAQQYDVVQGPRTARLTAMSPEVRVVTARPVVPARFGPPQWPATTTWPCCSTRSRPISVAE
jgi:Ca-activated chloride channel homolog